MNCLRIGRQVSDGESTCGFVSQGKLEEPEAKNLPKSSTERIPEMPAEGSTNMSEVPEVVSHHPVAKPVAT